MGRVYYNGRLEDGLEYECRIKLRCYSKMKTKEAIAQLIRRVNAKFYTPERGTLRMAIRDSVALMNKYTDRSYANQETVHKKRV